jgi:glycosyltransferase involved in cell wall biosynthesis
MSDLSTRVGIVMRTRDRPLFVVRALRAVLAQTHTDWHIVLVNDGGDPQSLRDRIALDWLAPRLPPARMTILDNPVSVGRAAAFNLGLAALTTDLVACLDDDDTWHPDFLASLTALYDRTLPLVADLRGVAAGVTAIREDVVTDAQGVQQIVRLGEDALPNAFRRSDFLLGPIAYATYRHDLYPVQWLLDRQAAVDLGGFPEMFEVMEDRAFLMRFVQHWRIATLDQPLAFHHRRVRRVEDVGRSAEMNTLDNPSYDWRRFSDLALPSLTTPPDAAADLPGMMRAVGASVVRELNDETSALWHKINGEAAGLRARLDALEARLVGLTLPEPGPMRPPDSVLWSLWAAVGPAPIGYSIGVATPFLSRLSLSHGGSAEGLLVHADPDQRAFSLQIPDTGGWCALEVSLDGLMQPGHGLICELVASLPDGGLFETALVLQERDGLVRRRHAVIEQHVHAATRGARLSVSRHFPRSCLDRGTQHKLSIILPRQARNLRLELNDLIVTAD